MSRSTCSTVEVSAEVCQNRSWIDAMGEVHPTSWRFRTRRVEHLFPPASDQTESTTLVLVKLPAGRRGYDKALSWAKRRKLVPTNPREVAAVAEKNDLSNTLEPNACGHIFVVAITGCVDRGINRVVCASMKARSGNHQMVLLKNDGFDMGGVWFAFKKESDTPC